MKKAVVSVRTVIIPTYPPCGRLAYPVFAENRVHQRTAGDPYPNTVTVDIDRSHKEDRAYTAVFLENEYVEVALLPEIGGRVWYARDKRTDYDFFYHQHVVKPALIGVLGNWVSGGIEFNQPFHHSPSGFMPYDHTERENADGSVECVLSANDPSDRMRAVIRVILPGEAACFTTRVTMFNRTPVRRSFLFWANAAVPVNERYHIFFPPDVRHVNFHYQKSRTTFPVATPCVYNGIPIDAPTDISAHAATRDATSYFAAASRYDYFGGYDTGKNAGVVHIADHLVSPGKKMFTWGYHQLSRSWERALTDTDGAYAELMAGSYSDNQPDFSWLAPYESKTFEEHWYPIGGLGVPTFATLDAAIRLDRENGRLLVQATRSMTASVTVTEGNNVLLRADCRLSPRHVRSISLPELPPLVTVTIREKGEALPCLAYTEREYDALAVPEPTNDLPRSCTLTTADELYLAGTHSKQYRDPAVKCDAYYRRALERDPHHVPSLTALAEYEYETMSYDAAYGHITRAIDELNRFNTRHESGKAYYLHGLITQALGRTDEAYESFAKAAWSADHVSPAMTRMALIDLSRNDARKALEHAKTALVYGSENLTAKTVTAFAYDALGDNKRRDDVLRQLAVTDPDALLWKTLVFAPSVVDEIRCPAPEYLLDTAFVLADMGRNNKAYELLSAFLTRRKDEATAMLYFAAAHFAKMCGIGADDLVSSAMAAPIGETYPHRDAERRVLEAFAPHSDRARFLLGCLLYHVRHYADAAKLWETLPDGADKCRCLAIAYFSHLDRPREAKALMEKARSYRPEDRQLLYESVVLMRMTDTPDADIIRLINAFPHDRDDLYTELARAYVREGNADAALETLTSRAFVPCEGGEHAVAEPYLYAYLLKGREALEKGDAESALKLFREGQKLPDALGAGIWNRCKLVPLKFFEGCALEALGEREAADAVFTEISSIKIDYFSDMHLGELPYFIALSLRHLGRPLEGNAVMTSARRKWETIASVTDDGFFATTPFFISFTDSPAKLRMALSDYRLALVESYAGHDDAAMTLLHRSLLSNRDNFPGKHFERMGFAK